MLGKKKTTVVLLGDHAASVLQIQRLSWTS
jgi:hypothetical protein